MHGLVVIEGMTLSGHLWIINEIKSTADLERQMQHLLHKGRFKSKKSSKWIIQKILRF